MAEVHLRPITLANYQKCLRLRVRTEQEGLVATNAQSLAEAYVNPNLVPLAVYDRAAQGFEESPLPMVGFTVYELAAGVGFILRLMIDQTYQGRGYGRAVTAEVIRRLQLYPSVEMIATSHRRDNEAAGRLYQSLGFVAWEINSGTPESEEVFLRLP